MTTGDVRAAGLRTAVRPVVPRVTLLFWLLTICATTLGGTGADLFEHRFGPLPAWALALAIAGLAIAGSRWPRLQRTGTAYWAAVVGVGAAATLLCDELTEAWNLPPAATTAVLAVGLASVLVLWSRAEGTLSVQAVRTRRRGAFYWLSVLLAFALGTAAGAWLTDGLGFDSLPSALIVLTVIGVVVVLRFGFEADPIATFWAAAVLSRPLGASLADWIVADPDRGGLGLNGWSAADLLLAVFLIGVVVFAVRQRRADRFRVTGGRTR